MNDDAAIEVPFDPEEEPVETRSWDFGEGDEIVPGRHALKKLGGGSSYEAYLAWDDHLNFLVVAKLVRPHLVENETTLRSLTREADALDRLDHPLLVRGFGAIVDGPRPHVVLEHLEGPHLARVIRRYGPLPLEQLIPLAVNLCSVVAYLSLERMVHLDVKPRNVVLGAPPRLIDLSVARSFDRAKRITGHVGTDAYMAPEQCDSTRADIGAPADVWGIGATLWHSIAGRVPFPRDKEFDPADLDARFPQLRREPLMLPKNTPEGIERLVTRCLQKEPAARPTAQDVALALEPFLASVPRKPVLGRLRPRLRR